MIRFPFLELAVVIFCTGCVHYPKSLDESLHLKKTSYTASLNFYSSKPSRIDDSASAKAMTNEFRKAGFFVSENLLYNDYTTLNNLIVDCELEIKNKGLFGDGFSGFEFYSTLLPFPIYYESSLNCSVHNKSGFNRSYKSTFSHSTYYFVLSLPIAIVQTFIYPSTYPEQILAQDILKQMSEDQLINQPSI